MFIVLLLFNFVIFSFCFFHPLTACPFLFGAAVTPPSQTPSPPWGTPSINRGRVVVLTVLPFEAGELWRGSLHASDGALLTSSSVHRGGGPPPE